VCKGVV